MDVTQYWSFARECTIWNTTVSALQFWTEDLKPNILSVTTERVYMAFFCSESSQQLCTLSEEILFGCFVTTLNDTFESELAQEDEGYESGSESLNIPTPLCRAPWLYHVSTHDNLSFGPATLTAHSPHQPGNLNAMCCHLTFKEDDDSSIDSNTFHARTEHHSPVGHPVACYLSSTDNNEEEEEKHFPTAPLNDDVWMEKPVPDRHSWRFTTLSVPLPLPVQLGSATPHSGLHPTVHGPQQHFWPPWCTNNCQWQGYSSSVRCSPTLNTDSNLKNLLLMKMNNEHWNKPWYTST